MPPEQAPAPPLYPGRSRWWRNLALLVPVGVLGLMLPNDRTRLQPTGAVNVLLISMDTTRRDHLGCYGYQRPTTPQLDALAREALLFTRCVATSNWTVPTHASMLTGQYPTRHGAHWVSDEANPVAPLADASETLAEVLSHAGYRAGAVVANAYLDRTFNLDQGFHLYDFRPGEPPAPYRQAAEITDEAIRWLARDDRRPFFLFLNYLDPHPPYNPPPPFNTRFRPGAAPDEPRSWGMRFYSAVRNSVLDHNESLSPRIRDLLTRRYDGEIAYTDEQLGRLLDWLRQNRLYESTLILVTADHGESFGEHALVGHSLGLYEPEIAVPMIVKLPYQRRRRVLDHRVSHADVMPTALEVLDLPVPGAVQGTSMLRASDRDVVSEQYICMHNARSWPRFNRMQRALYRGDLKWIEYSDGTRELFDLRSDPHERENLADARPDDARALQAALRDWTRQTRTLAENATTGATLPPELNEQLRDLGYLQ